MKKTATILAAAVLLTGCQTMQDNPKQTMGTLLGAGTGALIGSQIGGGKGALAAVAVGTLAGAFIGSEIGKSLDNADKAMAQRTAQTSLESNRTGQTSSWRNPDSGHSGTYTPVSTYRSAGGQDCREYETTVTIDGRTERATGHACRGPNGQWQIVQ
ncbi:MAG: glycine zipper 2TM domain-containing protein [Alphaproteobacteria bacterium]|nr:glycine zipper 2TM domain-containing protein [Alphaproteobacteria bacterium]